jgi:hypothetical protein
MNSVSGGISVNSSSSGKTNNTYMRGKVDMAGAPQLWSKGQHFNFLYHPSYRILYGNMNIYKT